MVTSSQLQAAGPKSQRGLGQGFIAACLATFLHIREETAELFKIALLSA